MAALFCSQYGCLPLWAVVVVRHRHVADGDIASVCCVKKGEGGCSVTHLYIVRHYCPFFVNDHPFGCHVADGDVAPGSRVNKGKEGEGLT